MTDEGADCLRFGCIIHMGYGLMRGTAMIPFNVIINVDFNEIFERIYIYIRFWL